MRASVDPRTFAPYGSCARRAAICASTGRSGRSTESWKSVSAPTWRLQSPCNRWKYWTWMPPSSLPTCCCPWNPWATAGEGPRIDNPVHTNADVDSLSTANTDDLGYDGEAIQNVVRSEEHTSELQSLRHLVCRLLLEKKKKV